MAQSQHLPLDLSEGAPIAGQPRTKKTSEAPASAIVFWYGLCWPDTPAGRLAVAPPTAYVEAVDLRYLAPQERGGRLTDKTLCLATRGDKQYPCILVWLQEGVAAEQLRRKKLATVDQCDDYAEKGRQYLAELHAKPDPLGTSTSRTSTQSVHTSPAPAGPLAKVPPSRPASEVHQTVRIERTMVSSKALQSFARPVAKASASKRPASPTQSLSNPKRDRFVDVARAIPEHIRSSNVADAPLPKVSVTPSRTGVIRETARAGRPSAEPSSSTEPLPVSRFPVSQQMALSQDEVMEYVRMGKPTWQQVFFHQLRSFFSDEEMIGGTITENPRIPDVHPLDRQKVLVAKERVYAYCKHEEIPRPSDHEMSKWFNRKRKSLRQKRDNAASHGRAGLAAPGLNFLRLDDSES